MRWKGLVAAGILLFCALCGAAGAEEDEAEDLGPHVFLYVDASAEFYISLYIPNMPIWADDAEARISEALGRPFALESTDSAEDVWFADGFCEGLFQRNGLEVSGAIPLANLVRLVTREESDVVDITLEHPWTSFSRNNLPDTEPSYYEEDGYFEVELTSVQTPEELSVQFGYRLRDIAFTFLPFLLAALMPVLFVLWQRKKALRNSGEPVEVVWFRFFQAYRIALIASVPLFFAALLATRPEAFFDFVFADSSWMVVSIMPVAYSMTLYLGAWMLCAVIMQPVQARIRNVHVSRSRMALQTASYLGMVCVPISFGVVALSAFSNDEPVWCGLFVLGAFIGLLASKRLWWCSLGVRLEALTVGELRDHVFELAEKAGVAVRQIYILTPAAKMGFANAVAAYGNNLVLTDYLVEHLNSREVDAVVAHELAHFKGRHTSKRLALFVVMLLLSMTVVVLCGSWVDQGPLHASVLVASLVVSIAGAMFLYHRIQEKRADIGALALWGEAEALITGLAKLARLNMFPLTWSRWNAVTLSHPSMMERFRVIARHAGISEERIEALLEEADADEACYDLPEAVLSPDRAFSITFKRRVLSLIVWSNVLLFAVVPALAGLLVLHVNLEGHARWAMYGGGIGLTVFAATIVNSFLAFAGWPRLKEKLRANLERDGIDVNAWGGTFVTLAPGGELRVYDGFSNWDVGFLGFAGDQLWYIGENTRFALRRAHIREARSVSLTPGWIRGERLCVAWKEPEGEREGSFYICPGEVRSMLQVTGASHRLEERMRTWLAGRDDGDRSAEAISRLSLPELDSVTGHPWRAVVNTSALFKAAMRQALWAFWVCVLFRLLWSDAAEYGPGLYAVAASVISMVAYHVPHVVWRGGARG